MTLLSFILYSSLLVVIALLSSLCINILHLFYNYQTTKLQLHFLKIFLLFLQSPSGEYKNNHLYVRIRSPVRLFSPISSSAILSIQSAETM